MKKIYCLVLFSVLFVLSCNQNGDYGKCVNSNSEFSKELREYRAAQMQVLHNGNTRAAGNTYTDEEVQEIAAKLDSIAADFRKKHPEIVAALPKITQDEFDVMSVDEDSLVSFVKNNYSLETSDYILNSMSEMENGNIVPKPKYRIGSITDDYVIANIYTISDFVDIAGNSESSSITPCKTKSDCYSRYKEKVSGCYKTLVRSLVLNIVGLSVMSPINMLYIAADYNKCLTDAAEFYSVCNK